MERKSRKQRDVERKIDDIIDRAEDIFLAKGYRNSTMDEIARAAEFTKRTVYKYFPTKEELYLRVVGRGFAKLNKITTNLLAERQPKSGLDKLKTIGLAWLELSERYPNYFTVINDYESFDQLPDNSIHAKLCYQEGDRAMQVLINALTEGKGDGSMDPVLDVFSMAIIAWGNIIGLINLLAKKEKYIQKHMNLDRTAMITQTFELIQRALAKPPSR